jgi:hypothetical protein
MILTSIDAILTHKRIKSHLKVKITPVLPKLYLGRAFLLKTEIVERAFFFVKVLNCRKETSD